MLSAVQDASRLGAISFDAVRHLVLCRLEGRPPRLDLELYPYVPRVRVSATSAGEGGMSSKSTLLLEHHLKELKLPSFLREYGKMAARCAAEGVDHPEYLLRLAELELIDRRQRMVERRIRAARFPAVKILDIFDFPAIPWVNKQLVMELARCEYIQHWQNVIAVGNSGAGNPHVALGAGSRRLPAGNVARVHHRSGLGARVDGGQGRKTPAESTAATVPPQRADRRRTGIRPTLPHRRGTTL